MLRQGGVNSRVVNGAGYQFLGIATRTFLTIGSTAVLARLLTPSDFGYVAMATVVTEFANLFGSFGFTNVLIQRRVINRLQCDTVFWATLAVGTTIAVGVFVASYFSHWLFADAQVAPLLQVMSLTFVLNSLSAIPTVTMSRLMLFGATFWIGMALMFIRTGTAIACAYAGMGLWSLVAGSLASGVANVVLKFAVAPHWPRWRFDMALLKSTWRTSGGYFGNTALYYVSMSLDLLLIGRQLGPTALGYYQNARSLTDEIRGRIAVPIESVLFPAMSSLQADLQRFQLLVLRAGRLLAALVVPIGVGVSANARELVLVLYGSQWLEMIPVMSMFGLSAALRAGTAISAPLFYATDRVALAMKYNAIGTLLTVAGVLVAMPHGLEAVALAVALASLYTLVGFVVAFSLIELRWRSVLQVLGPPFAASLVMWVATALLRRLDWVATPGVLLLGHVAVGAVVYLACLHLLSRQYLQDVLQVKALLLRRKA